MRSQYYYEPPRSNWLDRLLPLKEPPLAYLVALAGIILGIVLALRGSRYGYHLLILLIAFPIHELSHALVADRLGDPTPRRHGRITPNPLAQLNLIGSLMMLLVGLGWAYVPITPAYLRPSPRTGHMIVAAAGPISNLILAILMAIISYFLLPVFQTLEGQDLINFIFTLLFRFAFINLALFFFNLIPLAPLDGFAVLRGILPLEQAQHLDRVQAYSMPIFLVVFFLAPLLGLPILEVLIFGPALAVTQLLFGL